jgi:hypothetical protein
MGCSWKMGVYIIEFNGDLIGINGHIKAGKPKSPWLFQY